MVLIKSLLDEQLGAKRAHNMGLNHAEITRKLDSGLKKNCTTKPSDFFFKGKFTLYSFDCSRWHMWENPASYFVFLSILGCRESGEKLI